MFRKEYEGTTLREHFGLENRQTDMPTKGGLIMSRQYRLATEADADELLSLTLRAYEPIRKLGINFAAATADKELVLTNIQKRLLRIGRRRTDSGDDFSADAVGPNPGPYGVPHIWWFAVDPETGKRDGLRHAGVAGEYSAPRYIKSAFRVTGHSGQASVADRHVRAKRLRPCRRKGSRKRAHHYLFKNNCRINILIGKGGISMKKKTWALLLSAALLAVLSACGNGKESEGGDNVLHVGATGQSYPFAYKENGKLTGFDVDVMEAVAKNQHETGLEAA